MRSSERARHVWGRHACAQARATCQSFDGGVLFLDMEGAIEISADACPSRMPASNACAGEAASTLICLGSDACLVLALPPAAPMLAAGCSVSAADAGSAQRPRRVPQHGRCSTLAPPCSPACADQHTVAPSPVTTLSRIPSPSRVARSQSRPCPWRRGGALRQPTHRTSPHKSACLFGAPRPR